LIAELTLGSRPKPLIVRELLFIIIISLFNVILRYFNRSRKYNILIPTKNQQHITYRLSRF